MNGTNTSSTHSTNTLPSSKSPNLHLTHPSLQEKRLTWHKNASEWGKALSLPDYLEREETLCTASSLTRDGGLTHWILVDASLPADQRPILASCESIRKRTLLRRAGSDSVTDVICHGIGSVFCYPEYRGHGYASRMMTELGETLRSWQGTEEVPVAFSKLYSDIGKTFYTAHGWHPFPSSHVEFPAVAGDASPAPVKTLTEQDLPRLCEEDEQMTRKSMLLAKGGKTYVAIAPDMAHIEWHRARETFLTEKLFGRVPEVRGALVGEPGARVWAIWTRSYYGPVGEAKAGNTLHILRLAIEDEEPESQLSGEGEEMYDEERLRGQAEKLKAVVRAAQKEASEWRARHVELWNPSALVRRLVRRMGVEHREVERERESIASIMWYGDGSGKTDEIEWVQNEKYGWC